MKLTNKELAGLFLLLGDVDDDQIRVNFNMMDCEEEEIREFCHDLSFKLEMMQKSTLQAHK